jgi:hypothetical protein
MKILRLKVKVQPLAKRLQNKWIRLPWRRLSAFT